MAKLWPILSPILAAVATGVVAYIARGRRIPRAWQAAAHTLAAARHTIWVNTNWVLYSFIAAAVSFNLYQAQQLRIQVQNTRTALCSYREDLRERVSQQENEIAYPHAFGLSKIAVEALGVTVQNEKQAIRSLRRLGCPF